MSVLFFEKAENSYCFGADIVKDLNLQVVARGMALRDYGDEQDILQVLLHPLMSKEKIVKRQKLIADCCEHEEITLALRECIVTTTENLLNHIKAVQDCRGRHLLHDTVIATNLEALRGLVHGLYRIDSIIRENPEVFEESELNWFAKAFYEENSSEKIEEQKYLVDYADAFKNDGSIMVRANIGDGLFLKNAQIMNVAEKAEKVSGGLFAGRKSAVIVEEEIYESAAEYVNQILLEVLEESFPFIQRWQKLLQDLKPQIAFLAGCVKLFHRGKENKIQFSMPSEEKNEIKQIYDLSMALQTLTCPVTSDLRDCSYKGVIVTGANQGGKSTFLRSMGIAQVMCQAGMFVPARTYLLRIYENMFTHFTRREDASMNMGKFEEELKRMQEILKAATKDSLILLNESFATTTEVTAYQIAVDLLRACLESDIEIWMVTHITTFAKQMYLDKKDEVIFLSAGREAEGEVRYRMVEKAPSDTRYGLELFDEIVG